MPSLLSVIAQVSETFSAVRGCQSSRRNRKGDVWMVTAPVVPRLIAHGTLVNVRNVDGMALLR